MLPAPHPLAVQAPGDDSDTPMPSGGSPPLDDDSPPPADALRFGQLLQRGGAASVGRLVQRYWAAEGGWCSAELTGYNPEGGEFQLTYNKGAAEESFEWADLSELPGSELRDGAGAGEALPAEQQQQQEEEEEEIQSEAAGDANAASGAAAEGGAADVVMAEV